MVENDSQSGVHDKAVDEGAIPVASMVESIVGCKWSVRLLQLCAEGHRRPSALLRACSGLSAKVMNERLHKMIRFGILQRTVFGEKPPVEVEYRLTPLGRRFMRILEEVRQLQEAIDQGVISESGEIPEGARRGGRLTNRMRPKIASAPLAWRHDGGRRWEGVAWTLVS